MDRLKIVADENIPALETLFGHLGHMIKLPGRTMSADDLAGADVLLVRSVTQVDSALLARSNVRFVGTCTIGTDHLDKNFLEQSGIAWSAAPGCNAGGVVQYALAAMATYSPDWATKTVGIVGCGNVGGRLYRTLKALGVSVKVSDPFKSAAHIPELTTLQNVLAADIICMHTPLTVDGPHPTQKLMNTHNLKQLNPNALLINAGRGEVIDNLALFEHLQNTPSLNVVLDVWQGEPDIFTPLMSMVKCGTPHIAGYSFEGKLNGSLMIFEALATSLNMDPHVIATRMAEVKSAVLGEPEPLTASSINEAVLKTYNLQADNALIADVLNAKRPISTAFDRLRKHYWQRRELAHYFCPEGKGDIHDFLQLANGVQ
ncbi:4-phosphoerythronate dehydrogenase [Marinagarivorans algicola]|uniref:4-phosphoerythronate dehydrogenase n=1 Tax=Marinagarivorans algicola TaxID=1513270 RepID=UPI003734C2EE